MATNGRVMLVEDSPTQAQHVRALLQQGGLDVVHASSAEAALEGLETLHPDAIVLDNNLPGMSGPEFCRHIRLNVNTRAVPILMLTVEQSDEAQMRGLESGADDYVAKSADPDILLARVRNLVRKSAGTTAVLDITERFHRARVLTIDDSPTYLHFIARELRADHYVVETAANGAAGLEVLRTQPFDAVLVNLSMPEMDGVEVCRRIAQVRREHGASIVVILLTAHEDKTHIITGLEAGADDYVIKSADSSIIKARVRALLRRKFLIEENRRIVDELREKELQAVRARAEAAAAEVRASLADQLADTNRELKSANRRLEEALKVTRAITEHAADALLLVDGDGRLRFANPAAEHLFGIAADELPGRTLNDRLTFIGVDGARLEGSDYPLTRCLMTGKSIIGLEGTVSAGDGTNVDAVCSFAPIVQDGSVTAAVLVLHDFSEKKRSEERLRAAQKLESIALLAGGIAHDFNNLLTGILGSASLAKDMLTPGNPAVPLLNDVIAASERAADLTRQMLAYSGKGQYLVQPVDMSAAVHHTVPSLPPSLMQKVKLQLQLPDDLPPVQADPRQIEQVIFQLLVNAAEAMGDGPGTVTVRTSLQSLTAELERQELDGADLSPGDYVALEVQDTGCGMDESTRHRIFDPFFTTKFMGRGLGLAAVSGIVRAHQGAIKVTSEPGRGTTFLVFLPAAGRSAENVVSGDSLRRRWR